MPLEDYVCPYKISGDDNNLADHHWEYNSVWGKYPKKKNKNKNIQLLLEDLSYLCFVFLL